MNENPATAADPKQNIIIKNAHLHNLKHVDVAIPRNHLVVVTGLSGSGKSSLAFDTLYAEGQRRYVESLSSYARQFLEKLDKPQVEYIKGISPAIAIEQKVITRNARSTVGTSTEIYDYLKLLFARVGRTFSPVSGREVTRHTTGDVVRFFDELPESARAVIYAPYISSGGDAIQVLNTIQQQGFSRIRYGGQDLRIEELQQVAEPDLNDLWLVIDRVSNAKTEENRSRIADSVETAFYEGKGTCFVVVIQPDSTSLTHEFSNKFELDGMSFEQPSVHFFSFNNPVGACKTCEGFGSVIGIDPDLVIPDKSRSVYEDAIVCWRGDKMQEWKQELINSASKFNFPIHRPVYELTPEQVELLWSGNKYFSGIRAFFKYVESKSYKIQYRVMLSRFRGKTLCPDCHGTRLRKDANYVKVGGLSISELIRMPVDECLRNIENLALTDFEKEVADRLLTELQMRLSFLVRVGLGYLTLNRLSNTLSGGESQRIRLATSLGSSLVGSMYILDEPSIGLHPHDTHRLIGVLRSLQKLGNTVIVVEHDEEIMREADQIIDIGPMAGRFGGEVVFQGDHQQLISAGKSLTAEYLTGKRQIAVPAKRRKWKNSIRIEGARANNLKSLSAEFPLQCMVVVTGVSGSGKSTLVKNILVPAIQQKLGINAEKPGEMSKIEGDFGVVQRIEFVDQNPIGKSSRSNPVTYVKAFDEIRTLFSQQKLAKLRGYKPGDFSFNVKGGRCETCEGEGEVTIEMQFMADLHLRCESCGGSRYKSEMLDVKYMDRNISQVLNLTVDEALDYFGQDKKSAAARKVLDKLKPLQDVGLGYVQLGQSSSTLSGGEAQRTKLASFLSQGTNAPETLFVFDEPTTGLHFHDVEKLLESLNALIYKGHSLIIIEHNLDIIKSADWLIDLGPEGGNKGGSLVFAGTPEDFVKQKPEALTAKYLKGKLSV